MTTSVDTIETAPATAVAEAKITTKRDTRALVAPRSPKKAKATKKASPAKKAPTAKKKAKSAKPVARENSRKAELLALLQRSGGATLDELMTASGWQAHSVRGFLSGTIRKKMGLKVDSAKREDGVRVYSVAK